MPANKITVLILSLETEDRHELFTDQLKSLYARAYIKEVTDEESEEAIRFLADEPTAVIIADGGVATDETVDKKLYEYVKNGGIAIIVNFRGYFERWDDSNQWFEEWNLPWRTPIPAKRAGIWESGLNKKSVLLKWKFPLPDEYPGGNSTYLKDVPMVDIVYLPYGDTDLIPSLAPESGNSRVVFGKVGAGYLGFLGDRDAHETYEAVLLAMCGI